MSLVPYDKVDINLFSAPAPPKKRVSSASSTILYIKGYQGNLKQNLQL